MTDDANIHVTLALTETEARALRAMLEYHNSQICPMYVMGQGQVSQKLIEAIGWAIVAAATHTNPI